MINSFKASYKNCISNMDLQAIYPFHETEIQPVYSKYWYDNIISKLISIDDFIPINYSVLRSMLVMDIFDCHFANKDKFSIYQYYFKLLKKYYSADEFSIEKNIPNYDYSDLYDFTYFKTIELNQCIEKLYSFCYSKFTDIFADNGYEVIGPIYLKGYTFQIQLFRNLNENTYKLITYQKGYIPGTVDLFGHSTIQFTNSNSVLEINGNIIESGNDVSIIFEEDTKSSLEKYFSARLFRISKYFDINLVEQDLIHIFKDKKLYPRITDINTLISFL